MIIFARTFCYSICIKYIVVPLSSYRIFKIWKVVHFKLKINIKLWAIQVLYQRFFDVKSTLTQANLNCFKATLYAICIQWHYKTKVYFMRTIIYATNVDWLVCIMLYKVYNCNGSHSKLTIGFWVFPIRPIDPFFQVNRPATDVFEIEDFTAATSWEHLVDQLEDILREGRFTLMF